MGPRRSTERAKKWEVLCQAERYFILPAPHHKGTHSFLYWEGRACSGEKGPRGNEPYSGHSVWVGAGALLPPLPGLQQLWGVM